MMRYSRKILTALIVTASLTLTGCGQKPSPSQSDPLNAATFDLLNQTDFDLRIKPVCKSVATTFKQLTKNARLTGAISLSRQSDNWTARQAAQYVPKLEKNQELVDGAITKLDGAISKLLKPSYLESIGNSKKIKPSLRDRFLKEHGPDLFLESLQVCEVYNPYFQAKVGFDAYDYRLKAAQTLADDAPWYPAGYTEAAGGDVAYKWVSAADCSVGDYCWHAKFVAQDGCPGGLYAEINILDSAGNVIDWTNASASSLGPDSKAILEFSTFNSDAQSAEMSTVDCHY
jgi:hypothetical protein